MAYADKVIQQIFNEYLNNLHTGMPCTVVGLEPKLIIQPDFQRKKRGKVSSYPSIEDPPKLSHVPPLELGDKVLVIFAERALDFVGNRRHDLRDAIIIGKM
jgi:hypothetical protein